MQSHTRRHVVTLICVVLTACQPRTQILPTATMQGLPTDAHELPVQRSMPPPATLYLDAQQQVSGIGSYCWTSDDNAGEKVPECADAIGIPTATNPLLSNTVPFTIRFALPIADPPHELELQVFAVTESDEISGPSEWRWWKQHPGDPYDLPLASDPAIELALAPGRYVLNLLAAWSQYGSVGYGFLIQVGSATATPPPNLAAQPADNFGFVFEYSVCYREALDTFDQTYRRDVDTEPSIIIPVTLSNDQMRTIYDKLVEIDFLGYPSQYAIPTPENGTVAQVIPAYRYSLTVRNADTTHSVTWLDNIVEPTSPEATGLRELFTLIRDMVKAHPDVQKLPQPKIGCV